MPYTYRKEQVDSEEALVPIQRRELRQPLLAAPDAHDTHAHSRVHPQAQTAGHTPRVRRQKRAEPQYFQIVLGLSLIVLALLGTANKILSMNNQSSLFSFSQSSSSASQVAQTSLINKVWPKITVPVGFPVKQINADVIALSQADKTSYNNMNPEWSQWSYSACSGCAMAAIMNAYGATTGGRPLNCGDVLEVEYRLSVYRPVNDWGLITGSQSELIQTAAQFGFTGYASQKLSLDDLISLANSGVPSVVRIPTHIMLLVGGDSQNVFLADSGGLHLTKVTRNQFLHGLPGSSRYKGEAWMNGWYVILTPKKK